MKSAREALSRLSSWFINPTTTTMMGGAPRFDVKSVAVIGAGPCGVAAAKYLQAQGSFDKIVVFEKQDQVGGIWYYSDEPSKPCPVPQKDPFLPPDPPIPQHGSSSSSADAPIFPSPMYEELHANIPGTLMNFSDKSFPRGSWIFPQRQTIHEYLVQHAQDVRGLIRFCSEVADVCRTTVDGRDKWKVEAKSTMTDEVVRDEFDAVVLANGHYATPFIPAVKSISEFNEAHPSVVSHSKQFRTTAPFAGKKVIVVGNGPSGTDIAAQINEVCARPALLSVRHATPEDRLEYTGCREVPEIEEFLLERRGVRFVDGSVETGVDAVLYCTGFLYSYPFLRDEDNEKLITDGRGVHGLYKHLFWVDHPTLAFPGLNIKAIPWPLGEAQAAVMSAVWSNQVDLPEAEDMARWSRQLEEERAGRLHIFDPLEDGHYINEMHDWAAGAASLGKSPPRWDARDFWERSIYAEAKLRFEQDGCRATTLEQLGFHYEPEKEV